MVRRVFRRIPAGIVAFGLIISSVSSVSIVQDASACPLKRLLSGKNHSKDVSESTDKKHDTVASLPQRATTAQEIELVKGLPPMLHWPVVQKQKGVLLCLHELGMHAGRFEDLGKRMAGEGYSVYAMDLRGFGAWRTVPGKESQMSIERSIADTKQALEALKEKNKGLPIFLLGEAMGGAMALKIAAEYPQLVQGVISSAPGGEHFNTVNNYLQVGTKVLTGQNNKDANMAEGLIGMGTPRESLQRDIKSDPWVRMDLTPKELMSCQFFMYKTRSFAKMIKEKPVMIVQGARDGESKPQGAEKISDDLATKDKQFLVVKEGDHYVYQDSQVNENVMKDTLSFLDKHSTGSEFALSH